MHAADARFPPRGRGAPARSPLRNQVRERPAERTAAAELRVRDAEVIVTTRMPGYPRMPNAERRSRTRPDSGRRQGIRRGRPGLASSGRAGPMRFGRHSDDVGFTTNPELAHLTVDHAPVVSVQFARFTSDEPGQAPNGAFQGSATTAHQQRTDRYRLLHFQPRSTKRLSRGSGSRRRQEMRERLER